MWIGCIHSLQLTILQSYYKGHLSFTADKLTLYFVGVLMNTGESTMKLGQYQQINIARNKESSE